MAPPVSRPRPGPPTNRPNQGTRDLATGRPNFHLPFLCVIAFALSTWQVVTDSPLRRLDERVGNAIRTGGFPHGIAEVFADLGNIAVAVPALGAALAWITLKTRPAWVPQLAAALALAAVPALVAPIKALIDRPGPPGMDGSGGFYPSGHAATAIVAYGAAALLLRTHTRFGRQLIAVCALVVAANGFGLVRQGYHWPLDVLASWCLGGLILTALAFVVRERTEDNGTDLQTGGSARNA
ncbi:phosphatase PAP2 family protein [Streptomyces sp. YC504]|uniref:Phosphatase PAP2 family protein n=1 Tax=Streptomyces mesophilus TaxID=1775132 RepID=A0A6G4XV50_9ACTN|nr:phosphatase PAP2 family protein [Streptomyces mesophilus]